jgi:hypothetical protein
MNQKIKCVWCKFKSIFVEDQKDPSVCADENGCVYHVVKCPLLDKK